MTDAGYKLAIFDMDGVLTQNPSSWEFVHRRLGVDNRQNLSLYRRGELTYIDFLKSDVNLWLSREKEIPSETIVKILNEIPLRDGIGRTVDSLNSMGIRSVIISGGIYWLAEKIGGLAHFSHIEANSIKTDENGFIIPDGNVMVDPKHKDLNVLKLQERFGINSNETISVGDTLQDVAMFRHSGLSIAFNPVDEEMKEKATVTLSGNDLTALLDYIRDR